MTSQLSILPILKQFGFDSSLKTKLVRHQDKRYAVTELIESGWFELYQSLQAKPIFSGCKQIISFVGDGSTRARLIGVYDVEEELPFHKSLVPNDCPYNDWRSNSHYFYRLKKRHEFIDLERRVVIDWGTAALSWHQHLKDKQILEVSPPGRSFQPFSDYLNFTLSYPELKSLYSTSKAHYDWVASLSAVAGIYLILATKTGEQYIGSAYGQAGIWGRWAQYVTSGHGNNVELQKLVASDNDYPSGFRFSILQVLPKSLTKTEVIAWESQYKQKLGSRAHGLNLN